MRTHAYASRLCCKETRHTIRISHSNYLAIGSLAELISSLVSLLFTINDRIYNWAKGESEHVHGRTLDSPLLQGSGDEGQRAGMQGHRGAVTTGSASGCRVIGEC